MAHEQEDSVTEQGTFFLPLNGMLSFDQAHSSAFVLWKTPVLSFLY